MSASTRARQFGATEGVYLRTTSGSDVAAPLADTAAQSSRMRINRFGTFAAPWVVLASFFAPAPPCVARRVYSSGAVSGSGPIGLYWDLEDVWRYDEAQTTQAEIDALNALYLMSPPAGFSLDLPDA
jgi:hypothetical protein